MKFSLVRLKDEAGIALVTVLLVGMALTALASAAAFTTVQELRAGGDDRRSAAALAYAEAGIDRMIEYIRSGLLTWNDLRLAGCSDGTGVRPPLTLPPGTGTGNVGDFDNGTFTVELEVYAFDALASERVPPGSCPADPASTKNPRGGNFYFAITSTGTHPAATRVLRQIVKVGVLGLPIGIFADNVSASGTPGFDGISMVSPNDILGRSKMAFRGTDTYYTMNDFWPGQSTTTNVPAAVHSLGTIYLQSSGSAKPEHSVTGSPGPLNCTANKTSAAGGETPGTAGQSQFDQSGYQVGGPIPSGSKCSNWMGSPSAAPPTSEIRDLASVTPKPELSDQDYLTLRSTAKRHGLYCKITALGVQEGCTRLGEPWVGGVGRTITVDQDDVDAVLAVNKTFVAYIEYADGTVLDINDVKWNATVGPCSADPDLNKSAIVVVRNGNFVMEGNLLLNGALFVPEGSVETSGGATINGTVIADRFDNRGSASFSLNNPYAGCWLENIPGPFLSVALDSWAELDR